MLPAVSVILAQCPCFYSSKEKSASSLNTCTPSLGGLIVEKEGVCGMLVDMFRVVLVLSYACVVPGTMGFLTNTVMQLIINNNKLPPTLPENFGLSFGKWSSGYTFDINQWKSLQPNLFCSWRLSLQSGFSTSNEKANDKGKDIEQSWKRETNQGGSVLTAHIHCMLQLMHVSHMVTPSCKFIPQ